MTLQANIEVVVFTRAGEKRKAEYREYLQSPHWKKFRQRVYTIMPYCLQCGTTQDKNIAHLTYERRGKERLSDVVTLCRTHHYMMDDGKLPRAPIIRAQQRLLKQARKRK